MYPETVREITERLLRDYKFKQAETSAGRFLRQGTCPQCGKRELYAPADAPWLVRCGRLNKCGWDANVRELYPDVFEAFNKRHPPTQDDPNATARAYLSIARGLPVERLEGWYSQGKWWSPHAASGTATVRFAIPGSDGAYMERFVQEVQVTDPETGGTSWRKAHFHGSHKGLWWAPPGQEIRQGDDVWIVEGILDCIALAVSGIKAVAVLSCVNYPDRALERVSASGVRWVWALDTDAAPNKAGKDWEGSQPAGQAWTLKHVRRMRQEGRQVAAAQVPRSAAKRDWNDLYQRKALGSEDRSEYLYLGSLLIAKTASEKGSLIYAKEGRSAFPFEFRNRTYWWKVDLEALNKAVQALEERDTGLTAEQIREQAIRETGGISEIASCAPEALYFQRAILTDESWYYWRIRFPNGSVPVRDTFSGSQLAGAAEFKKRLLTVASGALWTGTTGQLDALLREQIQGLKVVDAVDFLGYSRPHKAWIFRDLAIRGGRVHHANDEDYFELGSQSVKTTFRSIDLQIETDPAAFDQTWPYALWSAFGPAGVVALAHWLGSLFAEQIRGLHNSYPFLEISGQAGSGKSTLIEFLWRLVGRTDYEGTDPSKATAAARARLFAQVSNLPVVLIEADRSEDGGHAKRMDWEELKTAYNGRSVRARGLKNGGNETHEPPFRGSIVISQNAPVDGSEAILSRIVALRIDRKDETPETRAAFAKLAGADVRSLSGFLLRALQSEEAILTTVESRTVPAQQALLARVQRDVRTPRIGLNHGQMIALVHALGHVVQLPPGAAQETEDFIFDALAPERERAINADHPLVCQWWELCEYLEEGGHPINHARADGSGPKWAVNINHVVEEAEKARQQVPPMALLKPLLKGSKHPRYVGQAPVWSDLWTERREDKAGRVVDAPRRVRCWVFE